MNVTLRQLQAFVEVARQGSFTRAARRLLVSQPALTVTIKEFEDELGVKLFDRTTRRVQLTGEGADFLPTAERLLADVRTAVDDVRAVAQRRRGRVGLAALPSVAMEILPAVLERFSAACPAISVHLHDANASGVQASVRDNTVDFGVGSPWQPDSDLAFTPLLHDRFVMVCRADHPLAEATGALTWQALEGHTFLGLAADTGIRPLLQAAPGLPAGLLQPHYEFSNIAALQGMLAAGIGITALPRLAVPRRAAADCVFRPLVKPTISREICLITRRGRALSPAAQALSEMLRESVAALRTAEIQPVAPAARAETAAVADGFIRNGK